MIDEVGGQRFHAASSEPVLPAIVEGVAGASGREFFGRLSEQLSRAFNACGVRVSELAPDGGGAAVLGSFSRLDFGLPAEFDLAGTPAEHVARGEVVIHEAHVRRAYPNDPCLSRMFTEAYVGVPMVDAQGDVIGLIEIFADGPISNTHQAAYVSRAMAGRAVAEIERDQAEAALRDSEVRYRSLIEDSFHLVAEVVDERYVYVSAGYTEALGHQPEELLGGSMYDLVHPEDRPQVAAELKPIAASHEAARYTVRMRHQNGSWRWIESTARAFRTSDGDYRTTIFSRDITQRLAAEKELRNSEELFRLLAEHSMDIIGRYTNDLVCTWISPSIKTVAGWEPEEIVGTRVRDRVHPDDLPDLQARRAIPDGPGPPLTNVMRYLHKDGHYIWLEAHTTAITDPQTGEILEIHNRARDVTARKLAEDQLRESEAQFRVLAENASDVIVRYDAAGTCLWISPSVKAAAGYEPEELIGTEPRFLVHPDDLPLALANRERVLASDGPVRTTFRWPHKDGHYIWVESSATAIRDPQTGAVVEIHLSARDISARKEAEDRLRASEELLRATLEASGDGVLVTRVGEEILYANARFAEMFDLGLDSVRQMKIATLRAHVLSRVEDAARLDERIDMLPVEGGDGKMGLLRSIAGRTFEVSARTLPQPEGAAHRVFSVHEVTDLVNASEALRKSEERYRALSESSPLGVYEAAPDGTATYFNERVARMAGATREELTGWGWTNLVHAEDRQTVEREWRAALEAGEECELEYRLNVTRGTIWVHSHAIPVRNADGIVEKYVGTVDDITTRKHADDALRQSEERYRSLTDSSPLGVFETDPEGLTTYVNRRGLEIVGLSFAEARGTGWVSHIDPEDIPRLVQEWEASKEPGREFSMEYRMQVPRGLIWVGVRAMTLRDEYGNPIHFVGTVEDVTDRHQAQEAMRLSEERFRLLAENATDVIVRYDAQGRCLWVSPSIKTVAGYDPEEIVGTEPRFSVHPDDMEAAMANRELVLQSDDTVTTTFRWPHKDGHYIWIESTGRAIRDPETGEVLEMQLAARDVSARMAAEQELRESEAKNRAILDAIPDLMFTLDREGRYIDYKIPQASGFEPSDNLLGRLIEDTVPAELAATARHELEQAYLTGQMQQFEYELPIRDGSLRQLECRMSAISADRVVAIVRDMTGERRTHEALRESEETARALLNAPTDGAVLIQRDGTILALNQTAQRRFKEHAATLPIAFDDFVGMCVYDLFPEALREERRSRNEQVFADGHRRHYEDERHGVWTDVTIDPIIDADGDVIRVAIFSRDITDRKRDEEALLRRSQELEALNRFLERTSAELERSQVEVHEKSAQLEVLLDAEQARSKTDPLTAALNHGAISDVMKEAIAADVAFAVAMVDIDGMKAVNDTYGHQTGDAVLLEAVNALNRGGAIVGRYGGDEFMVALLDADRNEATAYKASVDGALREAHVIDPETGATVPVVASVGIAWYPDDAANLPALIELADERMYQEKAQRRVSTGLSSSRMFADDRTARMVGELVALFTGAGTLEERFRLASHRITVGGGYAAASFAIIDTGSNASLASSTGAFGRASDELLQAWSEESRRPSDRPVSEIISVTRQPFVIGNIETSENVTEEQKAVLRAVGIRSGIVVPLIANDVLVATMSVGKKELSAFTDADERFLGDVCRQIAGIIDLARRAEDQARGSDATPASPAGDQAAA